MEKQLVTRRLYVEQLLREIEGLQARLDDEILREPTGYPRDQLTIANINLMEGVAALKEVV